MTELSTVVVLPPELEWVRPGRKVWYRARPGSEYAAIVDGMQYLIGKSWRANIVGLGPEYAGEVGVAMSMHSVAGVACDSLLPRDTTRAIDQWMLADTRKLEPILGLVETVVYRELQTHDPNWSPAYAAVLKLKEEHNAALARIAELEDELEQLTQKSASEVLETMSRSGAETRDFKARALDVILVAFGGESHIEKLEWHLTVDAPRCEFLRYGELASWDYSELTRLVVAAHDYCVRAVVRVRGGRSPALRIILSERWPDASDAMVRGHPMLEEHVLRIRERMTAAELFLRMERRACQK